MLSPTLRIGCSALAPVLRVDVGLLNIETAGLSDLSFVELDHGRNAAGKLPLGHHQTKQERRFLPLPQVCGADEFEHRIVEAALGFSHVDPLHHGHPLRSDMDIATTSSTEHSGK